MGEVGDDAPVVRQPEGERWCSRSLGLGFLDTREATVRSDLARAEDITVVRTQDELAPAGALPRWLGDEELYRSHQSALVRKDLEHYRRFFPDVPDDLPYVWPDPPTLTRTVNPSSSRPIDT